MTNETKIQKLIAALEFYADESNWVQENETVRISLRDVEPGYYSATTGGKLARQVLAEVRSTPEPEKEDSFDTMDIYSDSGTKVKFMNRNGTEHDRNYAIDNGLWTTEVYTVDYTEVGSWCSEVFLKEFPSKGFNTVMFKEVK